MHLSITQDSCLSIKLTTLTRTQGALSIVILIIVSWEFFVRKKTAPMTVSAITAYTTGMTPRVLITRKPARRSKLAPTNASTKTALPLLQVRNAGSRTAPTRASSQTTATSGSRKTTSSGTGRCARKKHLHSSRFTLLPSRAETTTTKRSLLFQRATARTAIALLSTSISRRATCSAT